MTNMMIKRILLGVLMVLLSAGILQAEEKVSPFLKKNAFSLKAGYHYYGSSDFTDFWLVDRNAYNGPVAEIAYERQIIRYLALEAGLGYHRSNQQYLYSNLIYGGDSASLDVTLSNLYLSLTLKPYFPLTKYFQLYLGIGPDIYYTVGKFTGEHRRGSSILPIDQTENKLSWGGHALAGAEFLVWKGGKEFRTYDMPVTLFAEYKYSYVLVKDFDGKVIDTINSSRGSSVSKHDLNVGGHHIFLGLRWRF